ncbi:MAG: hypothetical protein Q9218_004227 [Villophora microphyllina]
MDDHIKDQSTSSDDVVLDYVILDTHGRTAQNGKPIEKEDEDILPEGWEERHTPEGRPYYVDHNSKTTSWTPPYLSDSERTSVNHHRPMRGCLPAGWEEREATDGRFYYVDHDTRTTSWVRPIIDDISTSGPLPKGWERRATEDSRMYFVNHNDKTTSWDYPKHLLEVKQEVGSSTTAHSDAVQDSSTPKEGQ